MEQSLRSKLRSVVTQCRRLLEESIAQQLQGKYDIYATGKKDEVRAEKEVPLGHLTDEEREARRDILAHFEHVEALGYKPREALEQLIREIAFTHLNRLCAYKMMEVRDVYVGGQRFREAVSKGLKSQGFLFYLADHPEDERRFNAGQQEEAYRHFLNWLGGTLSQEIGVLFSPTDPANRVYPPQRVLDDVLDLLNSEELKGIWSEDETIGWVYQYFTPKELRDQARKESQAPRNSYELAFRNQFFTPRYVVEFLTDNTLGRIWYEMRQGRTRLADECRYMVRRPDEVFLARMTSPDEEYPQEACVEAARLLSEGDEASFPPFDESEGSVQRMIDMAHVVSAYDRHGDEVFGWDLDGARHVERLSELSTQFILDLLFANCRADRHGGTGEVYGDPWFFALANEARRRALAARDSDLKTEEQLRLPVFVPYRAKKDPREIKILDPACGSGHFLLYGFALLLVIYEEAYDDPELGPGLQGEYASKDDLRRAVPGLILRHNLHGIDIDLRCTQIAALALWLRCQRAYQEMGFKKDRPRITKSNIVCAEPMPGEGHMLQEFVAQLEPKLLGQLVEVVFDKMKLAGEAGSLLKIEEEIRDAVAKAREQWRIGPVSTQLSMFDSQKPVERQQRFDLSGITDAQFFEQAEQKVVDALRSYAEQAQDGQRLQRRLFADDAVRGFAFVDLCHKRFDVILMNPPFGEPSKLSKRYFEVAFPASKHDLCATFSDRLLKQLQPGGRLGAITSRTGFFLGTFQRWREDVLQSRSKPVVFADLGSGVLDTAMVETAAFCLEKHPSARVIPCFQLLREPLKEESLSRLTTDLNTGLISHEITLIRDASLKKIPGSPLAYWVSDEVRNLFDRLPPLQSDGRTVAAGLITSHDFRFVRVWWEVPPHGLLTGSASATREWFEEQTYLGMRWAPYARGGSFAPFFRDLATVVDWENNGRKIKDIYERDRSRVGGIIKNPHLYFNSGLSWPLRGIRLSVQPVPRGAIFSVAGKMAACADLSELYPLLGLMNSVPFDYLVGLFAGKVGGVQYEVGLIGKIPVPQFTSNNRLGILSQEACRAAAWAFAFDELQHNFLAPALLQYASGSLRESCGRYWQASEEMKNLATDHQNTIDDLCFQLYELGPKDRADVEGRFASPNSLAEDEVMELDELDDNESNQTSSLRRLTCDLSSYLLGCIFGRWDISYSTRTSHDDELPDPFSPLPASSPGSLTGHDGLPASSSPINYPINIDWDGILADDPDHTDDIMRRVRDVQEVIWKDHAEAIEKEACDILGVADLRDYFRKPGAGGFWDDHIKRYSKSRRKAPIYWLLQSSKKNYALWIYYHRLDKDILFKALLNYVEPKIRKEEARLGELRSQKAALGPAAKGTKKFDKEIDRQEAFLSELRDFEDKLRRAANLHLDPDLNDGVVLNIAPLHELVPWKEAKSYWNDLMDGKYEWSSIAKQLREKGLVP